MTSDSTNPVLLAQLWQRYALVTVYHTEHRLGEVVRVGVRQDVPFLDVLFRNGHRATFDEPFSEITMEAFDRHADTPV